MPRRRFRDPDPQVRDRNRWDAAGSPAIGGLSRIGGAGGTGGTTIAVRQGAGGPGTQIHHVTLQAQTSQTIASGGAGVTWDRIEGPPTEVRGFDTLLDELTSTGQVVAIPVDVTGLCLLILELQFQDATTGTPLATDGVDCTVTVTRVRDGVAADWPELLEDTDLIGVTGPVTGWVRAGDAVKVTLTVSEDIKVAGSLSIDVWAVAPPTSRTAGLVETMWLDKVSADQVTSTATLDSGERYTLRVTGNFRAVSGSVPYGSPDAVLFPSAGGADPDNGAMLDADTLYAHNIAGTYPAHDVTFTINTGSGATHIEPRGGPYTTPVDGHVYVFDVVGEGGTVTCRFADSPNSDNNGQFKIELFAGTLP